jgi:alpha-L-fucosidase
MKNKAVLFLIISMIFYSGIISAQKAIEPIPSQAQFQWHQMEYYAFVHFNMNTFTNMEWGTGGEDPNQFNPTELDCRQWAKVFKDAGMKGVILTAKHHDGFCLWPTKTTEHSVKNSSWKNGKGDVLKELSDACKEYGLKFGVYLSPWDRNNANYGKPEYIPVFREQLRELLTNYGDIFEVWFDGANGGSGYYGGANEIRKIESKTYYAWDETWAIVRELQPNAMIFGDGGPDVRWVGNEEGWANKTNWCPLRREEVWPGWPKYVELRSGHEDGTHWVPAEVDVSIRPGWYYHKTEDEQVKSLQQLLDIYYQSVGRNASLLLNVPPDARGLIHENDIKALMELAKTIKADFNHDLAKGQKVVASNVKDHSNKYQVANVIDGDKYTFWASSDGILDATLTFSFEKPIEFNRFLIQEYIPLGQRVQEFSIEAFVENKWILLAEETTIGYKRILRLPITTSNQIRIHIQNAKASPLISNIEIFLAK